MHAQQVPALAASLNSWGSFLIQDPQVQVLWHGKGASVAKRAYAELISDAARDRNRVRAEKVVGGGGGGWHGTGAHREAAGRVAWTALTLTVKC